MVNLKEFCVQGEEAREDYERVREIIKTLGATICLDVGCGKFQRIVGMLAEPPASIEYIEAEAKDRYSIEKRITCNALNGGMGMAELEVKIQAALQAKNLTDIKLQPYQRHLPIG